ncbi:MAG: SMC-Scp complex subunit ScpB [bacterium]|nr:SMC-Scp complex subunit ScpB [bacterium]
MEENQQTAPATDREEPESAVSAGEEVSAEELLGEREQAPGPDTERLRLKAILEAVVYITDEPLTAKQIAEAIERPRELVQSLLNELVADYQDPGHGLTIREVADGYQMATKAEHHEAVRGFVKKLTPPLKLSIAALETLAVIAYKQPITAPEVMEIRGVQGAGVLKTLLDRKLITTSGRKQVIGRPILYKTTKEFLVQFGLKGLNELPTLKEFEELARLALADVEEEPTPAESPDAPPSEPKGPATETSPAEATEPAAEQKAAAPED